MSRKLTKLFVILFIVFGESLGADRLNNCPNLFYSNISWNRSIKNYVSEFEKCKVETNVMGTSYYAMELPDELEVFPVLADKVKDIVQKHEGRYLVDPFFIEYMVVKCPCWKKLKNMVIVGSASDKKDFPFLVIKKYDVSQMKLSRVESILVKKITSRVGENYSDSGTVPLEYANKLKYFVWKKADVKVIAVIKYEDISNETRPEVVEVYYVNEKNLKKWKRDKAKFKKFCPTFVMGTIPFGGGLDKLKRERLRCKFEENTSPEVSFPEFIAKTYRKYFFMDKNFKVGYLNFGNIRVYDVACPCWRSIGGVELIFLDDEGKLHLMGVVKEYSLEGVEGKSVFRGLIRAIKKRIKMKPKIFTKKYVFYGDYGEKVKVLFKVALWRTKKVDIWVEFPEIRSMGYSLSEKILVVYIHKGWFYKAYMLERKKLKRRERNIEREY